MSVETALRSVRNANPLQKRTTFTKATLNKCREDPKFQISSLELVEKYAKEQNINRICILLDLHSDLIDETEKGRKIKNFFAILEASVEMMPLPSAIKILKWIVTRRTFIGGVSEGIFSINFLRVTTTLLQRLDPCINSEECGEVLEIMAIVKGFAHPARLNKYGKQYTKPVCDEQSDNRSLNNFLVEFDKEIMDIPRFLRVLIDYVRRATRYSQMETFEGDVSQTDWEGYSWHCLDNLNYALLLIQLLFSVRRLNSTDQAAKAQLLRCQGDLMRHLSNMDIPNFHAVIDSVLKVEPTWESWKKHLDVPTPQPSRSFEVSEPLELLAETTNNLVPQDISPISDMPIGSQDITDLLKTDLSFTGKPTTFPSRFQELRSQGWLDIMKKVAETPIEVHQRTLDLEEKMHEEKLQKEKERKREEELRLKRQATDDISHKRQRISYEEVGFQRGKEATARPLPY